MGMFREIMNDASFSTNEAILTSLRRAGEIIKSGRDADYGMTEEGHAILIGKLNFRGGPPAGLYPFDYTAESKAMLYAAGNVAEGEWIEGDCCADTGACDIIIPRKTCDSIPIQPALQSMQCMEYKVADGHTIPNLGERRCIMWTEGAAAEKKIDLQVADVHKASLSLRR